MTTTGDRTGAPVRVCRIEEPDRVRAYLEAGCTVPIIRFASWQQEAQFDAFAGEVVPRLRDLVEPAAAAVARP